MSEPIHIRVEPKIIQKVSFAIQINYEGDLVTMALLYNCSEGTLDQVFVCSVNID